jgi:hypothetical protein
LVGFRLYLSDPCEPAMPLTDSEIDAFAPLEKSYKRADERGLDIFVTPTGSKFWRMSSRSPRSCLLRGHRRFLDGGQLSGAAARRGNPVPYTC